jgi:hypothetical protein
LSLTHKDKQIFKSEDIKMNPPPMTQIAGYGEGKKCSRVIIFMTGVTGLSLNTVRLHYPSLPLAPFTGLIVPLFGTP